MMMGLKKFVTYDSSELSQSVISISLLQHILTIHTAVYFAIKSYNPF
jgi:hypothetical protein